MFDNFINEQKISCKILNKIIENKQFSHAYILETNGYNKGYDLALTFAKQILCPKDIKNCDECEQCKLIDEDNFPELRIIDESENWIKKENLISLQEEFSKKPIIGDKKVYIINHAEKLNVASSNSILKFLEEPQEGIIAILVVNNRFQLLETIVSRCQIISLNGNVKNNEDNMISRIGRALFNNEEDYLKFTQEEKTKEKVEAILKFSMYYEKNKLETLLYTYKYFHKHFTDKNSVNIGMQMLLLFYSDILNYKLGKPIEIYIDYKNEIKDISEMNELSNIIKKLEIINENINNLEYNANLNLLIDKTIIEMEGGIL